MRRSATRSLRRALPAVLSAAVTALGLSACGGDDPPTPANQPPLVSFVQRPVEGALVGESTEILWTGFDPDGAVARYETSLDSETEFAETPDTSVVLTFTREDGTDSRPGRHVFRVRAVDDRGLAGPVAAAEFRVGIFNRPPTVEFTAKPAGEGYIGPVARFRWSGSDPDGQIARFEYVLDDTTSSWTATAADTLTIDFSTGAPIFPAGRGSLAPFNRIEEYTLYLRALDNDDKHSTVARSTFVSGPANIAPTLTLAGAPDPPPFVVTREATWSWTALDPDGAILRVQYAVDLASPADWKRWDADSVTLEFTRADGTAEDPVQHTFFLRAQDDDSTYSATVTRDFLVGVPNQPPTIQFTQSPLPGSTQLYRFTYAWSGLDDIGIDYYEYAVDDSTDGQGGAAWVRTSATSVALDFPAVNVENVVTCGANGCLAFGDHRFFVRATDRGGLRSRTLVSPIRVFNRTPVTSIQEPAPGGSGDVTAGPEVLLRWSVVDSETATLGQKPMSSVLVREVDDFAAFPDAAAALTGLPAGTEWTAFANLREYALSLGSGRRYIVAVRSRDEAQATDQIYAYGRNVLKVTVP